MAGAYVVNILILFSNNFSEDVFYGLNHISLFIKKSNSFGVYPNVAKVGGLQSQGAEGETIVVIANPWQRWIRSPPAFRLRKKEGLQSTRSSSAPLMGSC